MREAGSGGARLRSFDRAALGRAGGRVVAKSNQNQDTARGVRSPDAGRPGDSVAWDASDVTSLDNVRRYMQDRHIDTRKVQDDIK